MKSEADGRLKRALVQHLEGLRAAGVTEIPKYFPAETLVPTTEVAAVSTKELSLDTDTTATTSGQSNRALSGESAPSDKADTTSIPTERSTLSRDDRRDQLESLCQQVAACTRCQELATTRTQTVFGVGNPEARILFIGEAPGADEDKQGEPFVGRAGQLLNRIIESSGLKREEIYICNILKCRPPGNRNPSPVEAANCREHLDAQLATIDPDYIVCWGSVAARNLLDSTEAIGKMRGKFYTHGRAKVVCTYHPSYLLRNPSAKKSVWEDMKFLMRDLGIDLDAK